MGAGRKQNGGVWSDSVLKQPQLGCGRDLVESAFYSLKQNRQNCALEKVADNNDGWIRIGRN